MSWYVIICLFSFSIWLDLLFNENIVITTSWLRRKNMNRVDSVAIIILLALIDPIGVIGKAVYKICHKNINADNRDNCILP